MIKFAKSLSIEVIKSIKKIFIYLRENEHLSDFAKHWKEIMIYSLQAITNPQILKEYFSFLREIFYYN